MSLHPTLHVRHRIQAGVRHANPLPVAPEGRSLQRVWTVMHPKRLDDIGLVHNRSAFIEDRTHDWRVDDEGCLRFYSRVVETDAWVDVVLDYETIAESTARREMPRFDPHTGQPLSS